MINNKYRGDKNINKSKSIHKNSTVCKEKSSAIRKETLKKILKFLTAV